MDHVTIELPRPLYDKALSQAEARQQSVDSYVAELLAEKVLPAHPYIALTQSRSGMRPIIKGTRVGVDVVIGYIQAGYTPQEIASDLLPHLTLAQVYDALSYYEDHRELVDASIAAHTPDKWRTRLEQEMGSEAAAKLLGG